jgi:hypothetical protein
MSHHPREIRSLEDYYDTLRALVDDAIARITEEHRSDDQYQPSTDDVLDRIMSALEDYIEDPAGTGYIRRRALNGRWTDRQLETITPPVLTDD